jgi:DNA-binding transcriptional LysR family regulator
VGELAQLRTFLAVYRSGSLTRAAGQLHLSQPAVTAHLKAVEAIAGRRLFVRVARGVQATPHGHALARELLPHLDAIEGVLQRLGSGQQLEGLLYIGGPADLLSLRVLPALSPLLEHGLRVSARLAIAEPLLDQLAAGDLDLVAATRRAGRRDLRFEPLFEEELVLVAAPRWAHEITAAAIAARGAAALEGAPLIAYDEELPILRRYFTEVFGAAPDARAAVVVGDLRAVQELLVAGAGVSVLPRYVAADALARGALAELHRPPRSPSNTIFLASRRGALEPRVAAVAATLHRAAPGWAGGSARI